MADIEAGPVPQPETIPVGFNEGDADEAAIERELLEAEQKGTSIGELEDAKQRDAAAKPEESKEAKEETPEPDNSETPVEEKRHKETAPVRDESGKFVKQDSDFAKAKKEKERLTRGWTEFEAECKQNGIELDVLNVGQRTWKDLERCKGFLRNQIDKAIGNERAQLEAERERLQTAAQNRGQFSPQEYQQAAKEFQQAAWKALSSDDPEQQAKAKELFKNASACAGAAQRTWEFQLVQSREKDVRDTIRKYPELDDFNSEAGQAMQRLIKENPYLGQLPNGFSKAAMFLKAQRDAARVPELEGQLKAVTAERDEARKQLKAATSLGAAGSQSQPPPTDFDNQSDEEQMRQVERSFTPTGEFVHRS